MASETKTREPPLKKLVDKLSPREKTQEQLRAQRRVVIPVDPEVTPKEVKDAANATQHARWARAFGYGMVPLIAAPTALAAHAFTVAPTFTVGAVTAAGVAGTALFGWIGKKAHQDVKEFSKQTENEIAKHGLTYASAENKYPGFTTGESAAQSHSVGHVGGLMGAQIVLTKKQPGPLMRLFHRTRFAIKGSAPEQLNKKLPTLEELRRQYDRTDNPFIKNRIHTIFSLTDAMKNLDPASEEYSQKSKEVTKLLKQHVS